MTNYNERLDEILLHLQRTASELSIAKGLTYKQVSQRRKYQRTRAKQAITSLIKELVAEAIGTNEVTLTNIYGNNWRNNYGYNETQVRDAANHLQRKQRQRLANLLKALEEV